MERQSCVLCLGNLTSLYDLPNVPITCSPTKAPFETDLFRDVLVCTCIRCGCVQLRTLIDPNVLYAESHNETTDTPTWKDHHRAFADFVQKQGVQSLTEIGGSSGSLYKHLPTDIEYTCLDLCESSGEVPNFIKANCETYDFTNTDCVCMSHVFEHLYSPRVFVENIAKHVKKVVLSIPNMNHLVSIKSSSIIFNEHTYFVDKVYLEWLFAQYQYTLRDAFDYRTHSTFLVFEKSEEAPPMELENRVQIAKALRAIFEDQAHRFSSLPITHNAFIAPAGHMGQMFFNQTHPPDLRGFLDNDRSKQGRRVYGTPHTVFSFDVLQGIENPVVYLYAGVYTSEITKQILHINSSTQIYAL